MHQKFKDGGQSVKGGERVCCVTFDAWQGMQERVHSLTSIFMPVQMNLEAIICCVARMPGWERSCS